MSKVICLLLPIVVLAVMLWDGSETARGGRQKVERRIKDVPMEGRDRGAGLPGRASRKEGGALLGQLDPALVSKLDPAEQALLQTYLEVLTGDEEGRQRWCWSEGTREEKVAAFVAAERWAQAERDVIAPLANQFLAGSRWTQTATDGFGSGGQGDPVIVTWSLVPDGTLVPGTSGLANDGSDLREWLAGLYGGSETGAVAAQPWFALFEEAFAAMAATCGVELRFEPNDDGAAMGGSAPGLSGVRGDLRIGARFLDGGGGFLGISQGPNNGDMVIDSGEVLFDQTAGNSLRLFNTLTHEIGHCLGLAHVCPVSQTKLMEPNLSTAFRGPQFDEFQSLQRLYGDPMERHGEFRDNDSAASATGLVVGEGEEVAWSRLSIDDHSDVDFFRIDALNGQRLEVEVIPGEGVYAEGGAGGSGCSAGVNFDSGAVNDLRVEIRDGNGEVVLAESDVFGPGGAEKIGRFELPGTGSYLVKVSGGSTNAAQLYELILRKEERLPGVRLVLGEGVIVEESGVVKNGKTDPGETVRVRFPLVNEGITATGSLAILVSGSANVTVFEQTSPGILPGDRSGFVDVVFGAAGVCGDEALLGLRIEDESGVLVERTVRFGLGEILSPVPIEENFDGGRDLPTGWLSEELGNGREWEAPSSLSFSDTPVRSAFTGGRSLNGEAHLLSPSFQLSSGGGVLSFRHLYDIESRYDGGVLEVSRDGGTWADLISGYGLEVTGGYDFPINGSSGSAIAGQMAWTGKVSQFVTTMVAIPAAWAGETLRFRWRFVQDNSGLSKGWWVDTVRMEMVVEDCVEHQPALNLRLEEGGLDENFPNRGAVLVLESELPLLAGFEVSLVAGGTAGGDDYAGDLTVSFPSGVASLEVPLSVIADDLVEGAETLTIAVPGTGTGFVAGEASTVELEVVDRMGLPEWLQSGFEVPVERDGDQDGDGISGLGEYLLGTDPTEAASRVDLSLVPRDGGYLVPTGELPTRADAVLGVEVSDDLMGWESSSFVKSGGGLWVDASGGWRFLRLTFWVLE